MWQRVTLDAEILAMLRLSSVEPSSTTSTRAGQVCPSALRTASVTNACC